jgi:CheY-like chemotaxis protein
MKNTQPIPSLLFVERDSSALWMYRELFEGSGNLFFSESVREAKEVLAVRKIDLVVSCYLLPDGNGLDLLNFTRSQQLSIPFVLCTGKDLTELPVISDEKFFVIRKPGPYKLQELVARCLSKFKNLNKPSWSSQVRRKTASSSGSWEAGLLKIPLCQMFETLDAIDDLDKIILEKIENEGSQGQLEKCRAEVAERRHNRWEFICYRMVQDAQLRGIEINRAVPFGKVASKSS